MSDDSIFVTACLPCFGGNADDVIDRLNQALRKNDHFSDRCVVLRENAVEDWRPCRFAGRTEWEVQPVPGSAQRLSRWDTRGPDIIFREGVWPRVLPENVQDLDDSVADLGLYGETNIPSVFVEATRTVVRQDRQGVLRPFTWRPHSNHLQQERWQYEIFAQGGIDVNRSLGDNYMFSSQHEIAFPGGVRREFIRLAFHYRGNNLIGICHNPHFDLRASGPTHSARLNQLLRPHNPGDVPEDTWRDPDGGAGSSNTHEELRRKRSVNEDYEDLMRGEGEEVPDLVVEGADVFGRGRACFLRKTEAYFFAEKKYVLIDPKPGTTNDYIINGPNFIVGGWPSLKQAGFGEVDAVLPNPQNPKREAYFFFRDQYALINIKPDTNYIINGPKSIAANWPSLRQAGFSDGIDAVLPNPKNTNEAYFFCKDRYALINISPGSTDDYIVNGPKSIGDNWPSLRQAGFADGLDAALPNPRKAGEAYFFCGDNYALINTKPASTGDYIVNGPKNIGENWPSLRRATFY